MSDSVRTVVGAVPLVVICALLLSTGAEIMPPETLISLGPVQITLARLLILMGLVALVVAEGPRIGLFHSRLEIPLALLLAVVALSTIKWDTGPRGRFLFESVALFYLVVGVVRARPESRTAITLIALVSLALSALGGIAQISQEVATGFYRDGCEPVTRPGPIKPPDSLTRATGTFANPNVLAGHILLLAPLAAVAAWASAAVLQLRLALGLVAGLGYLALLLTYSRTGVFIALIGIGIAIATTKVRHRWPLVALGLALAIATTFLFASCGSDAGAGYGRKQEWRETIEIAIENPALGIGPGRLGVVLDARDPTFSAQHAHNLFLNWWAEAGPVAMLAFIWIFGFLIWRTGRAAFAGDRIARGLLVALVGFGLFSLADHPANVDRVATAMWIVFGLAAGAFALRPDEDPEPVPHMPGERPAGDA
ncbi:MAG: O-antigen ligase family protein [Thermoleophilaceae bacterium]|nr:O-antigen ligase family protein [Thermoleophilaceae bacterium]